MLMITLAPPKTQSFEIACNNLTKIDALRFNVGSTVATSPKETLLEILKNIPIEKFWLDLKGRQLRITEWSAPNMYGRIILNHKIKKLTYPAKLCLRNEEGTIDIVNHKDNQIFLKHPPRFAVGSGQAVNILSKELEVDDYLTSDDKEYLKAAKELGINNILLSFVEEAKDIQEAYAFFNNKINLILKIESLKGLKFIDEIYPTMKGLPVNLMAARDDLYNEIGDNKFKMIDACQKIILADPSAYLASKIFLSLKKLPAPDMSDISDLTLMRNYGYRNYLLSDTISHQYLEQALFYFDQFIEKEKK